MSPFTSLDQSAIELHIPHRFENMLLDRIEIDRGVFHGIPHLTITDDDVLHRDLFFQTLPSGDRGLLSALSMEIIALASIVSTGQLPPHHLAFFAMISNYSRLGHIVPNQPVTGMVNKVKDRGGFLAYHGELNSGSGTPICSGDVMAFYADVSNGMPESEKKPVELPPLTQDTAIDSRIWHKHPALVFANSVRHLEADMSRIVTQYTFPADHPTARGHFPGNPVMMGVFQWTSVEDAFTQLGRALLAANRNGKFIVKGSAILVSTEGFVVAECKDASVDLTVSADYTAAELLTTKRFAFKNIQYPGDSFYTDLTITDISPV